MGLPLSSVSSSASSSACCSIRSATFQSSRPRCDGVSLGQGPLSKALRAAATARLISSTSPSATFASRGVNSIKGFAARGFYPLPTNQHLHRLLFQEGTSRCICCACSHMYRSSFLLCKHYYSDQGVFGAESSSSSTYKPSTRSLKKQRMPVIGKHAGSGSR